MRADYVLQTDRLTKMYGRTAAIDGVSMSICKGEIYGFVGIFNQGIPQDLGFVDRETDPYSLEVDFLCDKKKLGAIIEAPALYGGFTAWQNLRTHCLAHGVAADTVIPHLLEQVGLADTGNKKVKDFSLGMRQRLGIAVALIGDPEFLILDEPVNGLDPQGIVEVRELLKRLCRESGLTVLVSSHILGELSKLGTKFGFIERGRLLCELTSAELERACRKSITLYVDRGEGIVPALRALGIGEYVLHTPACVEIFAEPTVSALAFALRDAGAELLRVVEKDVDLEGYFMGLIGGGAR